MYTRKAHATREAPLRDHTARALEPEAVAIWISEMAAIVGSIFHSRYWRIAIGRVVTPGPTRIHLPLPASHANQRILPPAQHSTRRRRDRDARGTRLEPHSPQFIRKRLQENGNAGERILSGRRDPFLEWGRRRRRRDNLVARHVGPYRRHWAGVLGGNGLVPFQRQGEPKDGTPGQIGGHPHSPLMSFDDRTADR